MAVPDGVDNGLGIRLINIRRVDLIPKILLSDSASLLDGVPASVARYKSVHDGIGNHIGFMSLPRVTGELSRRVCKKSATHTHTASPIAAVYAPPIIQKS